MNTDTKIIHALTKIQECASLLTHGQECGFESLNLAEVHCIDRIGSMNLANVTKIANDMNMTRGAISKISRKLLAKGFIDSFQRDENRKEIYFRLTDHGQQIFAAHRHCHEHAVKEKIAVLASYSEDEQSVILSFLNEINRLYDNRHCCANSHSNSCSISKE